jgi:hypothetical protein
VENSEISAQKTFGAQKTFKLLRCEALLEA